MRTLWIAPFVLLACETFKAPPEGIVEGGPVLPDPNAALVVRFTKPFEPDTLKVQVVPYDTDREGNLSDEVDADTNMELRPYFSHGIDPNGDFGGTSEVAADRITIHPMAFPVGRKLALIVEPGLTGTDGVRTVVRDKILFSYEFRCNHSGTKIFTSGPYMFLINVESPVGTQIQLFAQFKVDPATGDFVGAMVNADRNRDGSRCPGGCKADEACRTVPTPACVAPSEKAATVDEWPDYLPNSTPPTGYSFIARGCAQDMGDSAVFVTQPIDLVVQQPAVTANGLVVLVSFTKDAQGVLRANGAGTAADILLGTKGFGAAKGTVTARSLPSDQLPPGIPLPP